MNWGQRDTYVSGELANSQEPACGQLRLGAIYGIVHMEGFMNERLLTC